MPLEYEMMEEPIDEIPDVESPGDLRNLDFGWSFETPACNIQSQVSWTLVKGPRESCDARHRRPNPGGVVDQVLSRLTRTQPPHNPAAINAIESEDGEDGNQNTIDGS